MDQIAAVAVDTAAVVHNRRLLVAVALEAFHVLLADHPAFLALRFSVVFVLGFDFVVVVFAEQLEVVAAVAHKRHIAVVGGAAEIEMIS